MESMDTRIGRLAAFTLIEMIVVILIIMVLMGFVFTAGQGVLDRTRKVQAKNDLTQIVTAINAYYTEYGRYPVPGTPGSTPDDFWIGDWNSADIFNVLRANGITWDSSTGNNLNPRRIVFIQPAYAKSDTQPRGGICPGSGSNAGKFYDPWGSVYRARIDWDFDNNVVNPYSAGAGNTPLSFGVIAFSIGKDIQSDADSNFGKYRVTGQPGNGDDDVLSWQ